MTHHPFRRVVAMSALAAAPMAASAAGLLGDDVNVVVDGAFGTVISGRATVGPGLEFTGTDLLGRTYDLDLASHRFSLVVSKPTSAGNFTGILDTLVIDGIDHLVTDVSFDAAASSMFSSGDPTSIDLTSPGRIVIDFGGMGSGNMPATATSHTYIWDVTLGAPVPAVPEPSTWALTSLGLVAWGLARRRSMRNASR